MGAIDANSVQWSEAQPRPKCSHVETTDLATSAVPSTSAPSSSTGAVTLEAIIVQFQCMDALLDSLTDKLCQVNTCVNHIARQQARLASFTAPSSLSLQASADEDGDDN